MAGVTLKDLGWDDSRSGLFEALCQFHGVDAVPGRVVAVDRGEVAVVTESGTTSLAVRVTDQEAEPWPPVVGDWVAAGEAKIHFVLPRKTYLERPKRGPEGQAVAANVDVLLIVDPLPQFSPGRVERVTAIARHSGVEAWLVATKADQVSDDDVQRALGAVDSFVDRTFVTTATDPDTFDDLREALGGGKTAVLFGR